MPLFYHSGKIDLKSFTFHGYRGGWCDVCFRAVYSLRRQASLA
jgi:hypothetical protein